MNSNDKLDTANTRVAKLLVSAMAEIAPGLDWD